MMEAEWTKQAEGMFKAWTEAQKKLWDDWLKGVQGLGRSQPLDVWLKTAEAWEDSVRESLKLQVEWTKLWAEGFAAFKGTPKEMTEWARQGQEMITQWAETQKRLWEDWLDLVKKLRPSELAGNWEREGQKFAQTWQEGIQKALDAQADWVRFWTTGHVAEGFTAFKGTPKEMTEWARQGQEMITQWAETQKRLWENWLDLVKKLRPSGLAGNWEREGQKFAQTWEEGIQKALDAQADWARFWTAGHAGDRTREKSKTPGA